MVCLGFEPGSRRMVGADETTELWRPPYGIVKVNESVKYVAFPEQSLLHVWPSFSVNGKLKVVRKMIKHLLFLLCIIFQQIVTFSKKLFLQKTTSIPQ